MAALRVTTVSGGVTACFADKIKMEANRSDLGLHACVRGPVEMRNGTRSSSSFLACQAFFVRRLVTCCLQQSARVTTDDFQSPGETDLALQYFYVNLGLSRFVLAFASEV